MRLKRVWWERVKNQNEAFEKTKEESGGECRRKGKRLQPQAFNLKDRCEKIMPPWREICWNSRSLMPPLLFAQFPFFQFLMHVRSLLQHTIRSDTLDDDGSGVNLLQRNRFPKRVFPHFFPRANFANYSLLTSMPITSF